MDLSRGGTLFGGSLLIAGTAIGGGMLALPVLTAPGGFFPAIFIYLLCWAFMTSTGLLLMEIFLWGKEEINIVSMAKMTLGMPGKIVAWLLYLFLFYSLSVAYVSGGGGLVEDVFEAIGKQDYPSWIGPLLFVVIFAPFVTIGAKAVDRINMLLMVGLILSFCLFVVLSVSHVELNFLKRGNFGLALLATPVMFTSFGFQGIVPTVTTYLDRDPNRVKKAIVIGSLIPLITYIIWEGLILGVVPLAGLEEALSQGNSAVYPLKKIVAFPWLYRVGEFFAFFAIITSFLGVTLGLLDFLADGLKVKKTPSGRLLLSILIFGPPLAFAMINPCLFLNALHYAGGLGCALLLGLLPIVMVWRGRYQLKFKSEYALFGGRITLTLLILFILLELTLMLVKIL
ncbi:MAG: Tyrosine-specific transport protein [Chlamydiales bacterium]|nr:Tyrosine-specific transport protein [Chlamydiales bacterium]